MIQVLLHYFLSWVLLRSITRNKEPSGTGNIQWWICWQLFITRDHITKFGHPDHGSIIYSRFASKIVQLGTLLFTPSTDHGFHLKPDTKILVINAFPEQLSYFDRSIPTLKVHYERNYLLFRDAQAFILFHQLFTAISLAFYEECQGSENVSLWYMSEDSLANFSLTSFFFSPVSSNFFIRSTVFSSFSSLLNERNDGIKGLLIAPHFFLRNLYGQRRYGHHLFYHFSMRDLSGSQDSKFPSRPPRSMDIATSCGPSTPSCAVSLPSCEESRL